jgi:hypothetical protein
VVGGDSAASSLNAAKLTANKTNSSKTFIDRSWLTR